MDVGEAGKRTSGVMINICFADALVECRQDLGGMGRRHVEEATPNLFKREGSSREARDDAKIVQAALESTP